MKGSTDAEASEALMEGFCCDPQLWPTLWEIKAETAKLEKTEEERIASTQDAVDGILKNDASRVKEIEGCVTSLDVESVNF